MRRIPINAYGDPPNASLRTGDLVDVKKRLVKLGLRASGAGGAEAAATIEADVFIVSRSIGSGLKNFQEGRFTRYMDKEGGVMVGPGV